MDLKLCSDSNTNAVKLHNTVYPSYKFASY